MRNKLLVFVKLAVILAFFSNYTYSQMESIAIPTGTDKGTNVTLASPFSGTVFCGTFKATVDGNPTSLYCIDLTHYIAWNEAYQDVSQTDSLMTYVLNNYYPFKTYPYTGSLGTVQDEATAVQLALWKFSDGLNVSACGTTTAIKNRALAIIADAQLNALSFNLNQFAIVIPPQSFTTGNPIQFYVQAFNHNGIAMPNVTISLSVSQGSLSAASVVTDSNGNSPTIILTPVSGQTTATITANGTVGVPAGTKYFHVANPNGKQKLILAKPAIAQRTIQAVVNWQNLAQLKIEKSADKAVVSNGDTINYTIKVTNIGSGNANNVQVSDQLDAALQYLSSIPNGVYNSGTGIWNVGTLLAGQSSTLYIKVKVNIGSSSTTYYDLGAAKPFNLFVIDTLIQPSSDTEGKVAVGGYADLKNYSVGDKLPPNSGDVLVVGNHLSFISGRVYNGRTVYGNFITSTTAFTSDSGIVQIPNAINFSAAKIHLNNLSQQLSLMSNQDTGTYQYNHYQFVGTDPVINVFKAKGSKINTANNFTVNVPSGSIAVVNIDGNAFSWKGGFNVVGTSKQKVLLNFYNADTFKISNIDITAAILAPKAKVNFPSGLVSGQVIVRMLCGAGQMNNYLFNGNVPKDTTIKNVATVLSFTQGNMPISFITPISSVVIGMGTPTDVNENESSMPNEFKLNQNYPNPFNPSTTISFSIARKDFVNISIYNIKGEKVSELMNSELESGRYEINFKADGLSSGIYFYKLTSSSMTDIKKMTVLK